MCSRDRFKSEGIKNDGHLLEVIRYIHNNPVKAGICEYAEGYPWSSYRAYIGEGQINQENVLFLKDVDNIMQIFSDNRGKAIEIFASFTKERTERKFIEIDNPESEEEITMTKRVEEILSAMGKNAETLKEDRLLIEQVVRELKFTHGIAGRQIAKLLGINRNVVQRIKVV